MKIGKSSFAAIVFVTAAMSGPGSAAAHEGDTAGLHAHDRSANFKVSTAGYKVPDLTVVRDDGRPVSLVKELDDGRPVVMNFIYTTCPGICPVMSQTFSQFQERLGADRDKVHMVSISIDPEQDTPPRLREYARKFSAGPQWQHYTGSLAASVATQKAFDAYRGDKMSHDPLTLMRLAPGKPWVRIDGFANGADLAQQYTNLAAIRETSSR
jgi:protein SCO1/2